MPPADTTTDQLRPGVGMLLVATPALLDPTFATSVVLLLEVDDDGALGVVLNRPSPVAVGDLLPGWSQVTSRPRVVFWGGPVGTDGALGVGLVGTGPGGTEAPENVDVVDVVDVVDGSLGLVDLGGSAAEAAGGLHEMRMFAGYAGWGRAQLEDEIDEGSWYVLPARAMDAFCDDAGDLRRAVLRRQPGATAWLSTRPHDPTRN